MKKLKYILLSLFLFLFTVNVYAVQVSEFYPTLEVDGKIEDNAIVLYMGFEGADAYKIDSNITIDTSKVELVQLTPVEDSFQVESEQVEQAGSNVTYKITATSSKVFHQVKYLAVILRLTNSFKVNSSTELKVSDIYAYSDDGTKSRNKGYYLNLLRDTSINVQADRHDITESYMQERRIYKVLPYIIISIVVIICICVIIVVLPHRKYEDRQAKIDAQMDPKNYPIPGVGPFPNMKRKPHTIIKPEEKTLNPLEKFKSKAYDVENNKKTEEIKKRPMEVDKEMFKDNPTKGGKESLININPLAFDDGDTDETKDDSNDSNDIDSL